MILNVGARTDIVNYYGEWLMERFREGFLYTRNPLFRDRVLRYELSPEKIDAILFCSKNYAPFLEELAALEKNYRLYCHYTITCYGKDVEPNVPSVDESIRTLLEVERIVGRRRLGWRYDPILLTPAYDEKRHLEAFEWMAARLSGHVDRCVVGFVVPYAKLARNMPELLPMAEETKRRLMSGVARIAERTGLTVQTCAVSGDYSDCGVPSRGCVTLSMLGEANGCVFRDVRHLGNRRGCACIQSRDVGWYGTCPNGCRYCYANADHATVAQNIARHNKHSPLLIGELGEDDVLLTGLQESYLKGNGAQLSIFDL